LKADADAERSANAPLVVIDGVIFNGALTELNVNDIKSVDVLKDASAVYHCFCCYLRKYY